MVTETFIIFWSLHVRARWHWSENRKHDWRMHPNRGLDKGRPQVSWRAQWIWSDSSIWLRRLIHLLEELLPFLSQYWWILLLIINYKRFRKGRNWMTFGVGNLNFFFTILYLFKIIFLLILNKYGLLLILCLGFFGRIIRKIEDFKLLSWSFICLLITLWVWLHHRS